MSLAVRLLRVRARLSPSSPGGRGLRRPRNSSIGGRPVPSSVRSCTHRSSGCAPTCTVPEPTNPARVSTAWEARWSGAGCEPSSPTSPRLRPMCQSKQRGRGPVDGSFGYAGNELIDVCGPVAWVVRTGAEQVFRARVRYRVVACDPGAGDSHEAPHTPSSRAAEFSPALSLSLSRDLSPCPAGVAQLAAHPTCNRAVGGSSPPVGSHLAPPVRRSGDRERRPRGGAAGTPLAWAPGRRRVDDAIRTAIRKAAETVRNIEWFETKEIRGQVVDGDVRYFQVRLAIGFRVED